MKQESRFIVDCRDLAAPVPHGLSNRSSFTLLALEHYSEVLIEEIPPISWGISPLVNKCKKDCHL